MKKFLALIFALVMIVSCFAACGEKEDTPDTPDEGNTDVTEPEKGGVIALGTSDLTITTEKKYVEGEISTEDTDENQVAYFKSNDSLVDFDVYMWAKATDETLASAAEEEAKEYNATAQTKEINGLSVAFYNAKEESEGKEYDTVTYMIDDGDYFVEIVFWLDGENAQAEVDAIIATLTKTASEEKKDDEPAAEGNVIELGTSGLKITTEKKYEKGEITEEDTDENQVAYFKSEETLVDFDVYEWAKADGETLAAASEEEAKEFEATVETKEINGLSVAYYNAKEESDGTEYDTVTYMIDNGEYFVEIVFWLDGENAQAEADAIIATLAK